MTAVVSTEAEIDRLIEGLVDALVLVQDAGLIVEQRIQMRLLGDRPHQPRLDRQRPLGRRGRGLAT